MILTSFKAPCQSELSWPEFYTKHMAEIDTKIAQLTQQNNPAMTDMDGITAGPSTDFLQPEFGSEPGRDPVIAFEAIR